MPKSRKTRKQRSKKRVKWTPVDRQDAEQLTAMSAAPGVVFPVAAEALPKAIQRMPGLVSCYASAYVHPMPASPAVTVGGELAVIRTDGDLGKAYNYVFGTSSDGRVCFTGPFKDFPQHHIRKDEPVVIFTIFNNDRFKPPGG